MAVDTTHKCPAPSCKLRVPFEQLACRSHWYSIPQATRNVLDFQWRRDPGSEDYFRARAACLKALGIPESEIADLNGGVGLGG
jgi:hypothetical protein